MDKVEEKKPIISFEVLEDIESLQMPGEQDIVTEIFKTFINALPTRIENLSIQFQRNDIKALSKLAHALKSSARTIGAVRLGDVCHELEHIEELGLVDRKEELMDQLRVALDEVIGEMKNIRPELK